MTEKHTPGPWRWDCDASYHGGNWLWSDDGAVIDYAGCGSHDTYANEYDRNLIAAAPELLDALKALLGDEGPDFIRSSLWDAARAAIAKAEGETNE